MVEEALAALRELPGADVKVCAIEGRSLEPIDVDFSSIRDEPMQLVYESLAHMVGRLDDYDYFINVEDDILVPRETLANIVAFDAESLVNEVLHPNRIEIDETGRRFCVDLEAFPGWTHQRRTYDGRELRVALNPHSGVVILSRDKLRYALRHIDVGYRGPFLKYPMDSAPAYYLSPFSLWRPYEDLEFHTVTHLDRWAGVRRPKQATAAPGVSPPVQPPSRWKALARDFTPPILLRHRPRRK
ncbi:MAG: hypothetical protein ACJ765_11335 [Chloroflexota bacterium]